MSTTLPSLDLARAAFVTIDLQRDTLDGGPLEIAGTSAVIPRVRQLAAAFRSARRPIVHVLRLYRADGSNAERLRRDLVSGATPILRPGTPGRLLAPGVIPSDPDLNDDLLLSGGTQHVSANEVLLYKPRWGAFYNTSLELSLCAWGVDTVVIAGANFPNCPRTSIYEASERDFDIVVAKDAVSLLDARGMQELSAIGVEPMETQTIVNLLHVQSNS